MNCWSDIAGQRHTTGSIFMNSGAERFPMRFIARSNATRPSRGSSARSWGLGRLGNEKSGRSCRRQITSWPGPSPSWPGLTRPSVAAGANRDGRFKPHTHQDKAETGQNSPFIVILGLDPRICARTYVAQFRRTSVRQQMLGSSPSMTVRGNFDVEQPYPDAYAA